jgi:hypothetical protein
MSAGYLLPSRYTASGVIAAPGTTAASVNDWQVWQPSQAWTRQEPRWRLIEALHGGTLGMQGAGTTWLPQEPRESDESYQRRLKGSVCPPYLQRMESMLAGMLTRVPLKLDGVVDQILEHLYDVDQQGNDLQRFLGTLARKALRWGHMGILVDYPADVDGTPSPRPYWIAYEPRQIIGWRTETGGNGGTLTQLRLYNTYTAPFGEWGEEAVEEVRVLEVGSYRVFTRRASRGQDWVETASGSTTLPYIPFSACYAEQLGTLESRPPLEEIAHLNLQAYQRSSDLANQLHLAAVPRLMIFGASAEIEEIEAGPEAATTWPVDARAEFIEPAGTSYQYQFQHLELIQQQIAQLGLATVMPQKLSAETATSKAIDRSQGDAALQVFALQLQDCIDNCLQFHADYLGLPAGSCELSRDFLAQRLDPTEVAQLIALTVNGTITQERLLTLLDKGGWMGDEFDLQEELQATEAQQQQRLREQEQMLQAGMNELPA